ncbi:LamG-like jellyroll fold domain-containing protein [Burkholderia arboris]|uniref:LamG-like jellyroll fold domain-containing protein n=1 Tax=Burkholderia arboris TaxID=488730 RepID=UPI00210D5DAB|nr:LamG-like jellyroll fold domain-containing protein [Burkholderia arboris]UTV59907.1 phospholipase D-like domain-containing protein [Burkholderia arboris]
METDYGLYIPAASYVRVPSNHAYDFGVGDFTVTLLFQTAKAGPLLARKSPGTGTPAFAGWYLMLESSGAIRMVTDDGTGYYTVTSIATAALDNTWHSAAVVRQNGLLTIYFDGNPVAASVRSTLPTPLSVSNGMDLLMGRIDPELEPNAQFEGVIEDVTLWNRALAADEIVNTIFNNVQPGSSGLVGLWEMNRNFTDSSTTMNFATPVGSVAFRPVYHCVWVEGVNAYSYCSIDMHEDVDNDWGARIGAGGMIVVPSNNAYNFGAGDFSITALFQTTRGGTIISRKSATESGPGDAGWVVAVGGDGALTVSTDSGSGYYAVATAPTTALNGHWRSIAVVRQAGTLLVYLDAEQLSTTVRSTLPTPLNVSSSTRMLIGNTDRPVTPNGQFLGVIEDVTIWNRAITTTEIQMTRFNGLSGAEPGLVGFWKMDNDFADASPTRNTGSASGAVTFTPVHHPANRRQSLNIAAGTPYLYGGVFDKALNSGDFPAETVLNVYRPDGTPLRPGDASDTQLIMFAGSSVQVFLIQNPQAGKWVFELTSPTNVPVLFNAQTIPSSQIPQTITSALRTVYSQPPAAHVRFLAARKPEALVAFTVRWADIVLWAGVGIATVAVVVVAWPVITGAAIGSTLLYASAVAAGVGSVLVNAGLSGQISNAAYDASYQMGVGSNSAGGKNTGSCSLVLDGENYFPLLRNLLMAVQTGSYDIAGKQPPVCPTFENMFKAVSDAGRKAYVLMFDTSAIYHMIENSDILKFYPRVWVTGVDGRDNYRARDALKKYANVQARLETYGSQASYTPIYSQHSKLAVFSVNGVKTALVGGFNITPSYWDDEDHPMYDHGNFHSWHDTAVLLQGPIVDEVEKEFDRRWIKANFDTGPANEATYVKFACYHVKHDTCLDGPGKCNTSPSLIPYENPLNGNAPVPVDVLVTSSEYEEKFTQIKKKMIEKIGTASAYVYFENFTFHDLDVVNALVNKVNAAPGLTCIINLPYPTNGNDTEDQKGQDYLIRIAFATMLINTGQWTRATFNGNVTVEKNQCSSAMVTFLPGKGIEYATFNYVIGGQSTSIMLGTSLLDVVQTGQSSFVFTSGVRYFTTIDPNEPKFQCPDLSPNFRSIYIHSKLALFDDSYAIVGSANFNSRSLTYDGECSIGISSTAAVLPIRQAVFAHWGMDTPQNWAARMRTNVAGPKQGVCAVPLPISVLSRIEPPWYWAYAACIYEFSDIN